eukprot:3103400-Pleurochrysis_carterae.AAC.1
MDRRSSAADWCFGSIESALSTARRAPRRSFCGVQATEGGNYEGGERQEKEGGEIEMQVGRFAVLTPGDAANTYWVSHGNLPS